MKSMSGNVIAEPWGTLCGVRPVKRVVDMLREGQSHETIRESLRNAFGISDERISLALSIAERELVLTKNLGMKEIALYIDIPFCPTRCTYCAFASFDAKQMQQYAEPYLAALYRELELGGKIVKDLGFTVRSIYIGGGTPTTLLSIELDNLLYKISQTFDLSSVTEFCVEAGRPDTITEDKLSVMSERGVTRISINPQTIHEKTLKRIGRKHTPEAVFDAACLAKKQNFSVINMDVIAGLPGETPEDFIETLKAVEAAAPENITVHTMSIKRASNLKGVFEPTKEAHAGAAKMLDFAYRFLDETGYLPYYLYRQKHMVGSLENTGFALPGTECLYNIGMMQELMTVMGFGVGSVTKLVRPGRIERIFNVRDLTEYLNREEEMRNRKQYMYTFFSQETDMLK